MKGVPRHLRNPRRWYNADGVEQRPATIANSKANGATGLLVYCECGHEGTLPFDGFSDEQYVPDVALRMICTACGRRDRVSNRPDFTHAHNGAGPRLRTVE